jgi:hypothetical protein
MCIVARINNVDYKLNNWSECASYLMEQNTASLNTDKKSIIKMVLKNQDILTVGLGYNDGGFIQFVKSNGEPPYYATYNPNYKNVDIRVFYSDGGYYTEIEAKHIIPIDKLVPIIRKFYDNVFPDFNTNDWVEI